MSQQNFHKYFTIYFIIFGIMISSFGAIINYMLQIDDIHKSTDKKAQEIFEIKTEIILKQALKNMDDIVNSLATNKTILEFSATNNSHTEEELEQIFLAVTGSYDKIMQARLLSKEGKEIIRVDRNKENGQAFLVVKEKLQDKSNRDYFQEVSKMTYQTIWHSKLDLNIENGKIEVPYKPTIRIAMPLFKNNGFIGMVIVNVLTNDLFDSIGKSTVFEHFIIDKDNNYILHPDNQFSFNKYKEIKRDLKEDFPNGLDVKEVYTYSLGNILNNDDNAVFVLKTNLAYEKNLINIKIKTAVIVLILTIILSFIIALYISRKPIKLQKALLKAHNKLNEFASIIDRYIITSTTKKDSTIISVSSAFVESSGYTKDELVGQKMHIISHPDKDRTLFKNLWEAILNGKTWNGEIKNKRKDGEPYWLEQHIIPTLNEDNEIETFVSLGVDITAKKELEKIAAIDTLTGIYNRRMVDEFIKIEVEAHKRHSYGLSVIMIDVDHFKDVNDIYGHQVGDIVLAQTAKLIIDNSRKSDISGRFGGEEFIIICPQTTSESAFLLAEKIRIAIESFSFEEVGNKTISLGIASFEDNDTVESLIKKADTALYQAKNSGRNKSVLYKM
ncbi:MAG: diguanylate cyclase [Aliarcobacter sp.]|nr:diguanylate cyclase [Aliarcobacter sp.]